MATVKVKSISEGKKRVTLWWEDSVGKMGPNGFIESAGIKLRARDGEYTIENNTVVEELCAAIIRINRAHRKSKKRGGVPSPSIEDLDCLLMWRKS